MPKNIFSFCKSLLFYIVLFLFSFLIPAIFFIPSVIFKSSKIADHGAKIWAKIIIFSLKNICGISYQVINQSNIPNFPCIFACKHQSMWETIIMHLIINRPVYAYKTELLKIPFYGWFLNAMSGIKVKRKGGASALKYVLQQAKKYLNINQSIVIFPQGTRVEVFSEISQYPYQPGIIALYQNCGVPVVPIALNSGIFWPKKLFSQKSGTILIEFLPPINIGLNKQQFIQTLTEQLEKKSKQLATNV
jgi:1-acyl-sn-glycerol-3-phosphate acyltransferase